VKFLRLQPHLVALRCGGGGDRRRLRCGSTAPQFHRSCACSRIPKSQSRSSCDGLCLPYAAGLFALVLWNLGKRIRKLEPAEMDTIVRQGESKPQEPD
jgi:hypothetical protein